MQQLRIALILMPVRQLHSQLIIFLRKKSNFIEKRISFVIYLTQQFLISSKLLSHIALITILGTVITLPLPIIELIFIPDNHLLQLHISPFPIFGIQVDLTDKGTQPLTYLWVIYLTKELLHLCQAFPSEVLVGKEVGKVIG